MATYRVRGMIKNNILRARLKVYDPEEPGGGGDGEDGNGENGNGGEEGEVNPITPEVPGVLPEAPPGVFPAPTPSAPILGPLTGTLEQTLPPGGVWPRPSNSSTPGHFVALCYIPRFGWRYIIIAPDAIAMPQIPRPEPQGRR